MGEGRERAGCSWGKCLGEIFQLTPVLWPFPDSVRGVPFPSCDLPPLGWPGVWTLLVPWRLTMNVLDTEPLDVT